MGLVQELRDIAEKVRQKMSSFHAAQIDEVANAAEKAGVDVEEVAAAVGQPEVVAGAVVAVKTIEELQKKADELEAALQESQPAPAPAEAAPPASEPAAEPAPAPEATPPTPPPSADQPQEPASPSA